MEKCGELVVWWEIYHGVVEALLSVDAADVDVVV